MDSSDADDLLSAYHYCDRIARQRARNFYPAFRFLPKQRRLALSAFYVFCSLSDDIADDHSGISSTERREKLQSWRKSLESCFAGKPDSQVFLALSDCVERFQLPKEPFFDLLRGIEMDLAPRSYSTFDELKTYCQLVASTVGLVSVRIFGCQDSSADRYADTLGIALQLTNILRDLSEDLRRNRVYLPQEDLERFSYSLRDLQNLVYDQRFVELIRFQYERAREYFHQADPRIIGSDSSKLLPAEIMKTVYRQILEEIPRRKYNVINEQLKIPKWRILAGISRLLWKNYLT